MGCSGTRAEDFLVDRVKKCRKKRPEAQERSLVGGLTTQLGEKDVEGLDLRAKGELGKVNNREATPKSQQEAVLRPRETSEPLTDGVKFQEPTTALLSNHGSEVQLKGHSQQYTNTGFPITATTRERFTCQVPCQPSAPAFPAAHIPSPTSTVCMCFFPRPQQSNGSSS